MIYSFLASLFLIATAPITTKLEEEEEFEIVETSHTLQLSPNESLPYTATTGTLPVLNEIGIHVADLFFISYTVPGEENRPVTFVFPGGPGGSCAAEVIC